jgi:hypothetical protein
MYLVVVFDKFHNKNLYTECGQNGWDADIASSIPIGGRSKSGNFGVPTLRFFSYN